MTYYQPKAMGLLAPIQPWLDDPDVSEILLNRPGEVYVEKSEQMTRYPISEWDELTLSNLFQLIANENKQRLHPQQPLLAAHLNDGSRIQLVIPPVTRYPVFALRRQVKQAMRLCDYQLTLFSIPIING